MHFHILQNGLLHPANLICCMVYIFKPSFPLHSFPLHSFPLHSFPLHSFPLYSFPLSLHFLHISSFVHSELELQDVLADSAENNTLLRRDVVFARIQFSLENATVRLLGHTDTDAGDKGKPG